MNLERDKFLTEAMGEHWHDIRKYARSYQTYCCICGKDDPENNDFCEWECFGKLWEWAQKQEWLCDFEERVTCFDYSPLFNIIHPDRFADAVYSYLKENP